MLLGFLTLAPLPKNLRLYAGMVAFAIFFRADLWFGQATNGQEIAFLSAITQTVSAQLYPHQYLYRATALLGCILLFVLLNKITAFRRASSPLPALAGAWILLVLAAFQLPNQGLVRILALLFAAKVGACLSWAGYLQIAQRGAGRPSSRLSTLFPLFGLVFPATPVLTNPMVLDSPLKKPTPSVEDFDTAVCRIKGLKLLLWIRILLLVHSCTVYLFFGLEAPGAPGWIRFASLHWPNYEYMGVAAYTAQHIPPAQTWIVIFINLFVGFFLRLALIYGAFIAVIRLSGFYVPRSIVRPYLAKTFNEYFRRSLYFYSEALVHFFVLPSWRWLYVLRRHKKLRLFLSLFLSLGVGGWFLHLSVATNYFLVYDWRTVLGYFLSWTPYYALVSVTAWWSAAGADWCAVRLPERVSWLLGISTAFTVHALLLALLPRNPEERWDERLKLLASLFHLS